MRLKKAKDVFEWDVVNWSRALPFWLKSSDLDLSKSQALEIGSRDGGLSVFLGENCQKVICSDLHGPTQKAPAIHQKYNLKNISYEELSAFEISKKHKNVDLIATKSVLGSFDNENQSKVVDEIHKSLRKGGEYWFVENLESTVLHRFMRKKFTNWGHRWTYIKHSDISAKFSKFSELKFTTFGLLGTFGINPAHRNFLGFLDKTVFDRVVPASMHYIVVGVAKK